MAPAHPNPTATWCRWRSSRRRGCLVGLLVFVSCASPAAAPPSPDAGAGGSGGALPVGSSSSTAGAVGGGGAAPLDAGSDAGDAADAAPDVAVDASPCAPFVETYMPACFACLGADCCDLAATCFAVHDCFGYASCQQNCPPAPDGGSNVCLGACAQQYPMPGPAFAALTGCLHAHCAGSCPY
jgi:hypothetical protein